MCNGLKHNLTLGHWLYTVYGCVWLGLSKCSVAYMMWYGITTDSPEDDDGHGSLSRYSRQLFASVGRGRPQVQDGGRPVSDDPAITLDSFLSGWLILPLPPPPPDPTQDRPGPPPLESWITIIFVLLVRWRARARLQEIITCSSCWLGNEWVNRSKAWRWRDSADSRELVGPSSMNVLPQSKLYRNLFVY